MTMQSQIPNHSKRQASSSSPLRRLRARAVREARQHALAIARAVAGGTLRTADASTLVESLAEHVRLLARCTSAAETEEAFRAGYRRGCPYCEVEFRPSESPLESGRGAT